MYKYFEDYSNRLCTYNFENWPFRGSKLKPSKLAMIGYECKEDGLFCNTCKSKFIISDPSIPNDVLLKQAYNTHEQNCPELAQIFTISQDFLHVYGQIYYNQCLETQIESIKLNQSYLDKIPNNFHYLLKDQKKVLAIFGWFRKDQFLICKFCGRKCEIQNDEEFDVFEEHRYFCKWANEGKKFKYGYLTLLLKLKDESSEVKKVSEINTVREQVIYTLDNIIKASQTMKLEEIQIKESITKVKEILEKRKRFSIQEFEKEWEEIEEGKKKKIKLQTEQLNQSCMEQVQNEEVEIVNKNQKSIEETIVKKQSEEREIYNIMKNEINLENQTDQINPIQQENIQLSSHIEQHQNQEQNLQIQNQDQNLQNQKIGIETESKDFPEDEQQKFQQIQQCSSQQIETNIDVNNEIQNEKKVSEEQDQQFSMEQQEQEQLIQPEIKAEDKIDQVKISEIDQNFDQERLEKQQEALQFNELENSNENKRENCNEIQIEQSNQVEDCNQQMIALQIEPNSEINENKIVEQDQEKQFPEIKDANEQNELQNQNDFQGLNEQQILNPFEEEQNIHTKVNLEDQILNNQQLEATKDQVEIENEVVYQNDLALNTLQSNIDQQQENQSDFLPDQRVTTDQQDQIQVIQEETQIQQS